MMLPRGDVCGCACPRTPLITQSSFVTEFQVNIELCFPSFQCPRSTSFRFLQKSDLDWDISWRSKFTEEKNKMNCFSRELNFHFALLLSFDSPTSFSSVSLGIGHHFGEKIWICVLVHRAPFPDSREFLASCPHPRTLPHPTLYPSCSCGPGVFLFNVPSRKQRQEMDQWLPSFLLQDSLWAVLLKFVFLSCWATAFYSCPFPIFSWRPLLLIHVTWRRYLVFPHCLWTSPISHAFAFRAYLREFLFSLFLGPVLIVSQFIFL